MHNPLIFSEKIINLHLPQIKTKSGESLDPIVIPGIVRIKSPGDGSCLFHSVLRAFNRKYNESETDQRKKMTRTVRNELAELLNIINPASGKTHYQTMGGGSIAALGLTVPEYSLESLQSLLRSDQSVGSEFMELLAHIFNIDIYIIDILQKDLYMFGVGDSEFHKGRNSIVLGYSQLMSVDDGHYDVIGLNMSNNIYTLFEPENFFILALKSRARAILEARRTK